MSAAAQFASRLSGFALATALTGLVGFATIPVLILASGAEAWSVVAFGQAVGVFGAVLIGWGWNVSGASEAALATEQEATDLLLRSVAIRALLVIPVGVLGATAAFLLSPHDPLLAAMSAVAYSLNGMSAQWFYTGVRAPRLLILREVLPRTVSIIVGLLVSGVLHSSYPFPVFMAAGVLVGVVLNVRGAGASPFRILATHRRNAAAELRQQFPALSATLVSTAYTAMPMVLVAAIAPSSLVVFALADRLFRTANMAGLPFLNMLQGSIPSHDPVEFQHRVHRGIRALLALGLTAAVAYALGAPILAPLLTGGQHQLPLSITVPYGVTLMASYLSQVLGLSVLVALGRVKSVAISATLGAVLGLPVLVLGTMLLGAPGAAAGVAVAEAAVTVYQLLTLRSSMRRLKASTEPRLQVPAAVPVPAL